MPNIIEITDFAAPDLDIYARLTEGQLLNRHEPDKGIFIAESPKVIERARLPCWKMSRIPPNTADAKEGGKDASELHGC